MYATSFLFSQKTVASSARFASMLPPPRFPENRNHDTHAKALAETSISAVATPEREREKSWHTRCCVSSDGSCEVIRTLFSWRRDKLVRSNRILRWIISSVRRAAGAPIIYMLTRWLRCLLEGMQQRQNENEPGEMDLWRSVTPESAPPSCTLSEESKPPITEGTKRSRNKF